MLLSYKYRIEPNRAQGELLDEMLGDFCGLYNAGLQQRIEAYRRRRVSVSYKMQSAELKEVREVALELARWSFSAEQQVLRRLDKTYKAFFRRGYGFPRFRAKARYHAAEFRVGDGLTVRKSGRIGFVGIPGEIRVRWHRELPSVPTSAILTRQCGKWHVSFTSRSNPSPAPARQIASASTLELGAWQRSPTAACPGCGAVAAKKLSRRIHRCECGCVLDRDVAAAMVIHHRAFGFWPGTGPETPSEPIAA